MINWLRKRRLEKLAELKAKEIEEDILHDIKFKRMTRIRPHVTTEQQTLQYMKEMCESIKQIQSDLTQLKDKLT